MFAPKRCVCGSALHQVPAIDAYSCLSCGMLIPGSLLYVLASASVVVAPHTREIPES
jgi:hypothetical protein